MLNSRAAAALAAFLILCGCSTIPDVTLSYYYPTARTQLQVTQTLACAADKSQVVPVLSVAAPANTYFSDRTASGNLRLKDLSGALSDADVTVQFTDDGRLKSINGTSAGQAGLFVKDLIALVAAIAPAAAVVAAGVTPSHPKPNLTALCDRIASLGGDKKAVTLVYAANLDYKDAAVIAKTELKPDPASAATYKQLSAAGLKSAFFVSGTISAAQRAGTYPDAQDPSSCGVTSIKVHDGVLLPLNKWAIATLKIQGTDVTGADEQLLATADVPVPMRSCYYLPIPKAPLFGKQNFVLQLSDYGSVQKVEYGNNTGANDATEALTAIAKAVRGPSASDQASALRAQADLIAAQTRLAKCIADPSSCQ